MLPARHGRSEVGIAGMGSRGGACALPAIPKSPGTGPIMHRCSWSKCASAESRAARAKGQAKRHGGAGRSASHAGREGVWAPDSVTIRTATARLTRNADSTHRDGCRVMSDGAARTAPPLRFHRRHRCTQRRQIDTRQCAGRQQRSRSSATRCRPRVPRFAGSPWSATASSCSSIRQASSHRSAGSTGRWSKLPGAARSEADVVA